MANKREIIARNIAEMLHDGDVVNLGVGIPSLVGNYVPEDVTVLLHCENGCIGMQKELPIPWNFEKRESVIAWMNENGGENGDWKTGHKDLYNANDMLVTLLPGACCFDTVLSFGIARGGHLDATVLGGLQVDAEGNLANWTVPGKKLNGMGGAMDLVSGAKKVIVALEHSSKDGESKLKKKCTMPLTGIHCVDIVVTDLCILQREGGKMIVTAMVPGITKEELQSRTEMQLYFAEEIQEMKIPS